MLPYPLALLVGPLLSRRFCQHSPLLRHLNIMLQLPGTLLGPMSPDLLVPLGASPVRSRPLGLLSVRYAKPRSIKTGG